MIRFTENKEQIISLWQEVFGDSREDVEFFLNNCKNKACLGYFDGNLLVAMLFLVDCRYCGYSGKYLYAVCTGENHRKRGYASKLINEAKKHMNDFLWLIPAEDYLFDLYSKYGFETKLYSDSSYGNKVEFSESDDIVDYLYDESRYEFPKGMIYSAIHLPDGNTGLIK